jgi:internalin A
MQNITIATQKHRLLALLLPSVEAAGMMLSPDRYIRLQRLWLMLSDDCPIDTMQNLLSPVFATDELQQDAFMDIFARVVRQDLELPAPIPKPDLPKKKVEKIDIPIDEPKQEIKPTLPTSTPIDVPQATPQRRSLVVELDRCAEPPYTWNIAPQNNETEINIGAGFNKTLLQLRRRESADYTIIDLPTTIKATIAHGGLPTFWYLRQTRPPEYLLLVERFSRNDHRSGLFDYVFQSLRANDVFVERFFYDSDPRINRNEQYPAGLNLYELRNRYPDARLVLLGSGYRLLSARTGKLAQWALPLLLWRVRALLTPVSRMEWGNQERQLDMDFLLLPASVESLQYIAESPDASDVQYESLPDYIRDIAETEPIQLQEPIMRSLRQHFDSGMLSWVAACAVYPALHFELTLQLGKVLSESLGYNLVTATNLLTISRLSWFTSGMIPVPVRKDLMKYLEQRHPERRMLVLEYLLKLMKENPPTNENSVAYAEHRVNLAVMKAMTGERPDAETVAELRAVVKRLDRDAGWGDFVLPEVWEEILGGDIQSLSVSDNEDNDNTKKLKILVIDDHNIIREALVDIINSVDKNISIDKANYFADVIDKDLSVFDLITTDVKQGRDLSYKYIKLAKEKYPDVPIVLISAHIDHPQDILNICSGNLVKSHDISEKVKDIINALKKGELRSEIYAKSGSTQKVFEAQMIVIGEPGSGKTTLIRKLIDKNALLPKANEATRGVEKQVYSFIGNNGEEYRVTITYFGGQERLQATNQLLYKQNALYLLVYNNDYSNSDLEKWLESVKMYGGGSPVILVHNAVNNSPVYYDASDELLKRFPFLIEQHSLDLGKNSANLGALTRSIQKNIQQLPHVGNDMPITWLNVRKNLEQLGLNKRYVSWGDYLEVCENNGIHDEITAEEIATYLHKLGSILYYANNALLKRIVILRPNWATETIYGILDNEDIRNRKGYFTSQELEKALLNQEWVKLKPELIELMKAFEICYQLSNKDLFIIPNLLPNYPQHTWDPWDNLQFELHYAVKPVALFNRLIVRMHSYIANDLVGRNQVVLKRNQTVAQITEFDNKIKIRIRGKEAKVFLNLIQNTFDDLHAEFINLKVEKFVPCKCSECLNSENPQLYDYEGLLKRVESNRKTIECPKSFDEIRILTLLEDVEISKVEKKPLKAFISYSKNDIEYVKEFKKQIQPLIRSNELILDDDTQILPGEDWDRKISMAMKSADIIFLMISSDYLASDFFWGKAIREAIYLHEVRQKIVVPIILRPCLWKDSLIGKLQGLPRKGIAINDDRYYSDRNEAWTEVVKEISRLIIDDSIGFEVKKDVNANISNVLNLISKAKIKEAMDEIAAWAHENNQEQLKSDISLLKGDWTDLSREKTLGLLSNSEAMLRQNELVNKVLNLVNSIEGEGKANGERPLNEQQASGKRKILMLTANPTNQARLQLDSEHSNILQKLQKKQEQFDFVIKKGVSISDFQMLIVKENPEILHFSGYGESSEYGAGGLILQDIDGKEDVVPAKRLSLLFRFFKSENVAIKVAILNACYSEEQAQAICVYVPYVIGTTLNIGDTAAIAFSTGFYYKLAENGTIEQAFNAGITRAAMDGADETYFAFYKDGQKMPISF